MSFLDSITSPANALSAIGGSGGAMTGIDGQYFFLFILDGSSNFLGDSGQIHQFTMEEKIGGDVPAFKLTFSTLNTSITKQIHEGSKISCKFGKSISLAKRAELMVQTFSVNKGDQNLVEISISGLVQESENFLRKPEQKAHRFKKSKEVIKETAKEHFKVVDKTEAETDDEQTWVRTNTPPNRFIFDTWKNSYISDDNFMMYAVTFNKEFVLTDLKAMLKKSVKWKLIGDYKGADPTTAAYDPDVQVSSQFGLINQMSAYKKETPVHSPVHSTDNKDKTPDVKASYVSGSANMKKDHPVKPNMQQISDHTNTHKNYHKAGLSNMTKASLQNSVELNITIENKWQDYELFDLVYYQAMGDDKTTSGTYAITRISRFYGKERCGTLITISRDGLNDIKGSGLTPFG